MFVLLILLGGRGVQRQNKDLNSYPPENGVQVCEISLESLVTTNIGEKKSWYMIELIDIYEQGTEFCFQEAVIKYNIYCINSQRNYQLSILGEGALRSCLFCVFKTIDRQTDIFILLQKHIWTNQKLQREIVEDSLILTAGKLARIAQK